MFLRALTAILIFFMGCSPALADSRRLGLNIAIFQNLEKYHAGITRQDFGDACDLEIASLNKLAVRQVRMALPWHYIEKSPGNFEFSHLDIVISKLAAAGIRITGILMCSPPWATGVSANSAAYPMYRPVNLDLYTRYCSMLAGRYKGKVEHWEIWNEPNIKDFWPAKPSPSDYMKLVRAGTTGVRRGNPAATVISGGLSRTDLTFLEAILKEDLAKWVDVIGLHPYRNPVGPSKLKDGITFEQELTQAKSLIRTYAPKHKIYITEIGWTTARGKGVTEIAQASYLMEAYCESRRAGVYGFDWFALNGSSDPENVVGGFGLMDEARSARWSGICFRYISKYIDDMRFAGYHYFGSAGSRVYRFERDEKIRWVVIGSPLPVTANYKNKVIYTIEAGRNSESETVTLLEAI